MRSTGRAKVASRYRMAATLALILLAVFGGGVEGFMEEKFEGDACQLEAGEKGICRRSDSCAWLRLALIRKRVTWDKIVHCGFDRDVAIICCRTDESVAPKKSGIGPAMEACANQDDVHSSLAYHILYGSAAETGQVPFIAALGYPPQSATSEKPQYQWGCGSSLIAPRFLLTAAHCIASGLGEPVVVRMGAVDLTAPANTDDVQDRTVKRIILHPNYRRGKKYDDIALIEVDSPFLFQSTVKPACLSTNLQDLESTVYVLAAGWGKTERQEASPGTLFLANLTTVPVDKCWQPYQELKVNMSKSLPNGLRMSQYCALGVRVGEYERTDTCEGDSGGPLYYVTGGPDAQKYYLLGITSFGLNCGSSLPSVYTRVAYYLDWIASHVWPEPDSNT